ncbi:MAG: 4-alpha-glucanotransferase, partial [Alphaproteobacteria bacterium]
VQQADAADARAARAVDVADLAKACNAASARELDAGKVHAALAATPAVMVAVQLDDVCAAVEQQNLPGTIEEHPNWRRRTALNVGEVASDERLVRTGAIMRRAGRAIR